jgi:hypothetical protein
MAVEFAARATQPRIAPPSGGRWIMPLPKVASIQRRFNRGEVVRLDTRDRSNLIAMGYTDAVAKIDARARGNASTASERTAAMQARVRALRVDNEARRLRARTPSHRARR